MSNNVKALRVIILIYSLLGIAAAAFIIIFLMTISCDSESSIRLSCILIGGGAGLVVLLLNTITPLIIRSGLGKESKAIYWLTIVFSLLIIFYFPIGTALAVLLLMNIRK